MTAEGLPMPRLIAPASAARLLWPRHSRNPALAQVLAALEDLDPREHPSGPVISPRAGEETDTEAASRNA
jgi:hypothetical protein